MPKPMAPSKILKKLPRGCGSARARQGDRSGRDRGLVCRRGPCRTEEQDHPALGQARFAPLRAARSTHRLVLYLRRDLPQGRQGRGPCLAPLQHRGDEPASGRDRAGSGAGWSRSARPRPGRLAPVRQAHRAAEYHARPAAAQGPRTQSGRECLAVHPRQLALQPRLPLLRRHSRTLLLCLEQPRRPALDNHVNRVARLGAAVLIKGTWYKAACPTYVGDTAGQTCTVADIAVSPHILRGLAPRTSFWRDAQFDTIRLCLIKMAGRVTEMVTRIKIALPTACPYQIGFATFAARIAKLPP